MTERYIFRSRLLKVQEEFFDRERKQSLGWFVLIEGLFDSIRVSDEAPHFKPGQRVRLIVEDDAAEET